MSENLYSENGKRSKRRNDPTPTSEQEHQQQQHQQQQHQQQLTGSRQQQQKRKEQSFSRFDSDERHLLQQQRSSRETRLNLGSDDSNNRYLNQDLGQTEAIDDVLLDYTSPHSFLAALENIEFDEEIEAIESESVGQEILRNLQALREFTQSMEEIQIGEIQAEEEEEEQEEDEEKEQKQQHQQQQDDHDGIKESVNRVKSQANQARDQSKGHTNERIDKVECQDRIEVQLEEQLQQYLQQQQLQPLIQRQRQQHPPSSPKPQQPLHLSKAPDKIDDGKVKKTDLASWNEVVTCFNAAASPGTAVAAASRLATSGEGDDKNDDENDENDDAEFRGKNGRNENHNNSSNSISDESSISVSMSGSEGEMSSPSSSEVRSTEKADERIATDSSIANNDDDDTLARGSSIAGEAIRRGTARVVVSYVLEEMATQIAPTNTVMEVYVQAIGGTAGGKVVERKERKERKGKKGREDGGEKGGKEKGEEDGGWRKVESEIDAKNVNQKAQKRSEEVDSADADAADATSNTADAADATSNAADDGDGSSNKNGSICTIYSNKSAEIKKEQKSPPKKPEENVNNELPAPTPSKPSICTKNSKGRGREEKNLPPPTPSKPSICTKNSKGRGREEKNLPPAKPSLCTKNTKGEEKNARFLPSDVNSMEEDREGISMSSVFLSGLGLFGLIALLSRFFGSGGKEGLACVSGRRGLPLKVTNLASTGCEMPLCLTASNCHMGLINIEKIVELENCASQ